MLGKRRDGGKKWVSWRLTRELTRGSKEGIGVVWEMWKMALGRQERMVRRSYFLCSRPVSRFQNTETSLCSKCSFCGSITQRTVTEECKASQIKIKRTEVTAELVKSQSRLRKQSVTVIYNCFGLYVPASLALNQRHRTSCRSVNTTRLLPAMSAAPPCHRSVTGLPCKSLRQSGHFSVVVELVKLFENLES